MRDINKIDTSVSNYYMDNYKNNISKLNSNYLTKNNDINNIETLNIDLENIPSTQTYLEKAQNSQIFFEKLDNFKFYGVDQGCIGNIGNYEYNGKEYDYYSAKYLINNAKDNGDPLPIFIRTFNSKQNEKLYSRLIKKIEDYGFSKEDADLILNIIDTDGPGVCTYASTCNEIFHQFSGNPELFKEIFGYDMYKNGIDLNSEELLLDLYLYANDKANGGYLWENGKLNEKLKYGEVNPMGTELIDGGSMRYMSSSSSVNTKIINGFLSSKNPNLNYSTYINYNISTIDYPLWVKSQLEEGKSFRLSIHYNPESIYYKTVVHMISDDEEIYPSTDTSIWGEGGGHSVTVTGINNVGYEVSSWGNKYTIPYEDLKLGINSNLWCTDITTNSGGN